MATNENDAMAGLRSDMSIDKSALSVASLFDESDEKAYWLSKTPLERLAGVELSRQMVYGYDPTPTPIQKVLEIVDLTPE